MAERWAVPATSETSSKIGFFFYNGLIFGTLLHILHRKPTFPFWGPFRGFPIPSWGTFGDVF